MRPEFPKRALVTAGMPYANKGLHFGHIGGVFVPADCYARFLRNRIGKDKVLFVSGTDCYGSSIDEGYRKLKENEAYQGSVHDFVLHYHDEQSASLAAYNISLDIYEGSSLGLSKEVHEQYTEEIITRLHANGWLHLDSTAQFYDTEAQVFLNGRQVEGYCPVQGCKSQRAYADECDMGHQYRPEDLLNPKSTVTQTTPELCEVNNWYFKLPEMAEALKQHIDYLRSDDITRSVVTDTMEEFLVAPLMYVKQEHLQAYQALASKLPTHHYRATEKGKASFELEFNCLDSRDKARALLSEHGIRFRTGKALVPFRITGNASWGVSAPVIESIEGLTVWCWPESLWAPLSFTRAWLKNKGEGVESLNASARGSSKGSFEDYWCSKDATVYQFIGQDNIFFYGIAQTALWAAHNACTASTPSAFAQEGQLQQTKLVANYHLLFLDKKASSSADIKPPMADDLLEHYTAEQLRAHFIALGLGKKPVSFRPQVLDPHANKKDPDPVLKESALLTNIFNRLARSCFYEAQKNFGGLLPLADIPEKLLHDAQDTYRAYEWAMYKTELHTAFEIASEYLRRANKHWSDSIKDAGEDTQARKTTLASAFYLLRMALLLMHPIVPQGCELIFKQLNFDVSADVYFSWKFIGDGNDIFFSPADLQKGGHPLKELPPRFDFFKKHPSQW
ncbi:MAG: class I tRNA ligase family protein [Coriobacteriia bacterium]|nr:class I tRNA ligase family protein [Coriobacteriia bacterium]